MEAGTTSEKKSRLSELNLPTPLIRPKCCPFRFSPAKTGRNTSDLSVLRNLICKYNWLLGAVFTRLDSFDGQFLPQACLTPR
jgi:hypothetical protein